MLERIYYRMMEHGILLDLKNRENNSSWKFVSQFVSGPTAWYVTISAFLMVVQKYRQQAAFCKTDFQPLMVIGTFAYLIVSTIRGIIELEKRHLVTLNKFCEGKPGLTSKDEAIQNGYRRPHPPDEAIQLLSNFVYVHENALRYHLKCVWLKHLVVSEIKDKEEREHAVTDAKMSGYVIDFDKMLPPKLTKTDYDDAKEDAFQMLGFCNTFLAKKYVMSTDIWSALPDTAYVEERDQRFVKYLRSRQYLAGWVVSCIQVYGLYTASRRFGGAPLMTWCGAE